MNNERIYEQNTKYLQGLHRAVGAAHQRVDDRLSD